jgi:apolipoprotein N-acyltransferase
MAVATTASALLFFLGTGLHPVWWLMWLAPLPVLAIAPRFRAGSAFLSGAIAQAAGGLNLWTYLRGVIGVPSPVVVAALLLPALVFGVVVVAFRRLIRRNRPGAAMLVVPVLWVAYEYVYATLSPHGTFGLVAYSQMDWLPIAEIASVTGAWGVSFCVFLFSSMLAVLVTARDTRRAFIPAGAAAVVILAVVFWGGRRAAPPADSAAHARSVAVVLLASDAREHQFPETDAASLALFRLYAAEATQLAGRLRARDGRAADAVIVLPEKIGAVSDAATAVVDDLMRQAATASGATIVAGLDRGDSTTRRNEARVYAPAGDAVVSYDKHHLIPGLEDIDRAGTSRVVIDRSSGRWGVEICKDMDFPALSRTYARDGVDLLLVPAWDFDVDGWLHSRMAILRGIEGGFAIARAARHGRLTITDARGRFIAEASSAGPAFSTVVAAVPVSREITVYARFGDWFAWLALAVLAVIVMGDARTTLRGRAA